MRMALERIIRKGPEEIVCILVLCHFFVFLRVVGHY